MGEKGLFLTKKSIFAEGCESQREEMMSMKAKLLATLGRSEEARELLLANPSIKEVDRALILALIYKAENKLGNDPKVCSPNCLKFIVLETVFRIPIDLSMGPN